MVMKFRLRHHNHHHQRHQSPFSSCTFPTTSWIRCLQVSLVMMLVASLFVRYQALRRFTILSPDDEPLPLDEHLLAMRTGDNHNKNAEPDFIAETLKRDDGSQANGDGIQASDTGGKVTNDMSVYPSTNSYKPSGCAIALYGLPRAFEHMILPSLEQHVLPYNLGCDYFVHYYDQEREPKGRSSAGGSINATEVWLLRERLQAMRSVYSSPTNMTSSNRVLFTTTTLDEFQAEYADFLNTIHTVKTVNTSSGDEHLLYNAVNSGPFLYHPELMDNIVKMWHSIQSVWELLERKERVRGAKYSQVAVLRVDVVYVTPLNLSRYYQNGQSHVINDSDDNKNNIVVIPGFGRFSVSDRGIYGARDAVRIWASERFSGIDAHVRMPEHEGWGMHSEYFLQSNLLPRIRKELNIRVVEDERWCFLRARADCSIWTNDCEVKALPSIPKYLGDPVDAVSKIIGRPCKKDRKMYQQTIQVSRCPLYSFHPLIDWAISRMLGH